MEGSGEHSVASLKHHPARRLAPSPQVKQSCPRIDLVSTTLCQTLGHQPVYEPHGVGMRDGDPAGSLRMDTPSP